MEIQLLMVHEITCTDCMYMLHKVLMLWDDKYYVTEKSESFWEREREREREREHSKETASFIFVYKQIFAT